LRVKLAAAHGTKVEVSKRERLKRQTEVDPIPPLFVCVLPDGPLEFGGSSWLTSRKSTLSDAIAPIAKKKTATPAGIAGQVSLIVPMRARVMTVLQTMWGHGGGRPNTHSSLLHQRIPAPVIKL
jgi:hypothetical protein